MSYVKRGILGGTFNPIHKGHITLAKTAKSQYELDSVVLIPSGISYQKTEVLDSKNRLEMVLLATEDEKDLQVSDMEVLRKGNTYTIDTIRSLTSENPNEELYFIIGEDSLYHIESWKESQSLFKSVILLVAHRKNSPFPDFKMQIEYLQQKYGANIQVLEMEEVDISSTDIREKIKNHISVEEYLDPKVIDYITAKQLYESKAII